MTTGAHALLYLLSPIRSSVTVFSKHCNIFDTMKSLRTSLQTLAQQVSHNLLLSTSANSKIMTFPGADKNATISPLDYLRQYH